MKLPTPEEVASLAVQQNAAFARALQDFREPHVVLLYDRREPSGLRAVRADSEEGFLHFYENHKPSAWDYQDIYFFHIQIMNTTTQQALEAARIKLDQVSAELRALEARAAEEARGPWEPKGGSFYLCSPRNCVDIADSDEGCRMNGTEYPTRASGESALPYVTFFKRLCCLAAELNPSGKVGGSYRVACYDRVWRSSNSISVTFRDPWELFENSDAALKACEILNRDGWKTPSL